MDVLSSMATIAGYKAVLLAANRLPKMFPLLMTAAGTLTPAKVLVIGAGVAGLQAIATARRLGAVVQAYDVRAAVKEQIESLGAKFVELEARHRRRRGQGRLRQAARRGPAAAGSASSSADVVAACDVCITTAAIPGTTLAAADHRRRSAANGARLGDRRPGGRARRQLRADQAGRDGRRKWRDDPRSHQPGERDSAARQPDVCEERGDAAGSCSRKTASSTST